MSNYFVLSSGREIGVSRPCFIVAEIGNNHQGRFELAARMIEEAASIGVDAVKFQKRHIPSLLNEQMYNMPYKGRESFGDTYGEHRKALELSIEEFARLKTIAEERGLVFFASVWDEKSLEEVDSLGVEIIKIPSADLVNIPLLRKAALLHKLIILSTGMSTLEEIDVAVNEVMLCHDKLILMHCNSSYPCREEEIALPVIPLLAKRYGVVVGYSGHEKGIAPSIGAVSLGACVVERHLTLNREYCGTDHKASLTPREFKMLVEGIREVEKAMAVKEKRVFDSEKQVSLKLRKSIVAAKHLSPGHVLEEGDIVAKSPGYGISPIHWDEMFGKIIQRELKKDDVIMWEDIK